MDDLVHVDKIDYFVLRNLYNKAVEEGEKQFEFKGRQVLVTYAYFILEHLQKEFEKEAK